MCKNGNMLMTTNILLTDMKHYFLLFILLLTTIAMGGCTEELQPETSGTNEAVLEEGELTEAVLNLSVNTFAIKAQTGTRASIPSSTPETETAEEKEILNIWVFQYDAVTEELLIKPYHHRPDNVERPARIPESRNSVPRICRNQHGL